jgi:hypothetical protein
MAVPELSVEGPSFAERVRKAEEITQKLQANQWNFDLAPEIFGKLAACDVFAKEIVNIHDGRVQMRLGRLVMKSVGTLMQLESPESSLAETLNVGPNVFDEVNRQLGSKGLNDFPEFRKLDQPQEVDFYGLTSFYQARDLVFWSALHECGLSPSGFEDLARNIYAGQVVRSLLFRPSRPSLDPKNPAVIQAHTGLQIPTPVVKWIPKPIFGGISKKTLHIDTLLTLEPTNASHPYLPLVSEGTIVLDNRRYYMRRFAGISPKDALRGPGVPQEGATS